MARDQTKTGGRAETSGIIPGDCALSVGKPDKSTPEGWGWVKLTDVARLETGHTPSRKHSEYWGGDVPWIGIKDATGNHGETIFKTNQYTNELGISNSSARILPAQTVCLSRTASVGYVIVMGVPMSTSQDFVNWVCDETKLDYNYLRYVLLAENASYARFSSGTTHQTIYFPEVKAFHICMPDLGTQKAISGVLRALDNKIALNRQINTTLESMAQALFKSWFVDFDPVIDNALATGNEIPEELQARADRRCALLSANTATTAARLPQDIQQRFPDRFVFTEDMGWVPEGWEVASLDSVTTELRRGISPKYLEKGGVRVVNQKCIRNHLIDFSLTRRNDPSLRKVEGRKLEVGDVLVNSTGVGTLGRMAQVLYLAEPTVVDSHVTVVRPNTRLFSPFTFGQALQSVESLIEAMGEGSTGQTELSRKNLQEFKLLLPSLNCQKAAEPLFISFAEKIQSNLESTEILANLRDSLLPKLLSGQLSIPEAEQALDEVN
jgi:type I restriction enzyme, S subunit